MLITFPNDHQTPDDSQLILAVTGSPAGIKRTLERMLAEMNDAYGKPRQGTIVGYDATATIQTAKWNGKDF